jgi:hypothetical protein
MDGSIKLHRCLLDSQVFAHQVALKIWIWCLCKASYKERFLPFKTNRGEKIIKLLPGQFIFGRFKAEEETGIDGSTIYKWIQKFASSDFDMIKVESNNKYSIITICNWDEYQIQEKRKVTAKEQHSNNTVTTEEQHSNTNNKVKNVYNEYYDAEIIKSENNSDYIIFVKFLFGENGVERPFKKLLTMDDQIGYKQFIELKRISEEHKTKILDTVRQLENYNKKNYKSFYLTMCNWLKPKEHVR